MSKLRYLQHTRTPASNATKTLSELASGGNSEELLEQIPTYHSYRRDYRLAMWLMLMPENSANALVQPT